MIQKPAMVRNQIEVTLAANQSSFLATFSRFLSKKVWEKSSEVVLHPKGAHDTHLISTLAPEYEYDWHYMAFCTLWRSSMSSPIEDAGQLRVNESTDETNVLLCFDLDDDFTLRLRTLLHKADLKRWKNEPFLMLEHALSVVIDQCEKDLWSFQKPVRDIEKVLPLLKLYFSNVYLNNDRVAAKSCSKKLARPITIKHSDSLSSDTAGFTNYRDM
jgi:hypothetical protein